MAWLNILVRSINFMFWLDILVKCDASIIPFDKIVMVSVKIRWDILFRAGV